MKPAQDLPLSNHLPGCDGQVGQLDVSIRLVRGQIFKGIEDAVNGIVFDDDAGHPQIIPLIAGGIHFDDLTCRHGPEWHQIPGRDNVQTAVVLPRAGNIAAKAFMDIGHIGIVHIRADQTDLFHRVIIRTGPLVPLYGEVVVPASVYSPMKLISTPAENPSAPTPIISPFDGHMFLPEFFAAQYQRQAQKSRTKLPDP